MFFKFVDIMSRSWGNYKAALASEWTSGVILKWQKQWKWLKQQKIAFNFVFDSSYNFKAREKFIK